MEEECPSEIKIAELEIKILFISTGTHFDLNSTKSHNIPLFKERKFQTGFPLHFLSLITIATTFYRSQCIKMCKTRKPKNLKRG